MAKVIRDGLSKKVGEIKNKLNSKVDDEQVITAVAKKLNVEVDRLMRIYKGSSNNDDVNYDIFDSLEFPLDLSIHCALGKPKKLNDAKIQKEWQMECQNNPMLRAAAIVRSSTDAYGGGREVDTER